MTTVPARLPRPRMNLWRLEWLRLIRTPRALALGAVFVFFGLLEPVLTRYQSQIFRHVGNGVHISFPPRHPGSGGQRLRRRAQWHRADRGGRRRGRCVHL